MSRCRYRRNAQGCSVFRSAETQHIGLGDSMLGSRQQEQRTGSNSKWRASFPSKRRISMHARYVVAVAALGLGTMSLLAYGQQEGNRRENTARQQPAAHAEHSTMLQSCAKACGDCQRQCDACSTHCAHQLHAGKAEHAKTLFACQDCADVCAAAAQIVARGGPFSATICKACADACAQCAKECDAFPDDEHMKRCADECRTCEKACREMLGHADGDRTSAPGASSK